MKDFFLGQVFAVLLAALILAPMVGRVQAADPVLFPAFTFQVETVEQVVALQQALCREFRYEPQIFDPVYTAECTAFYGPGKIPPTVYPERIQIDPFCENPPAIDNPESCPDFANRKMVAWFEKVVEKNDTALLDKIQTYAEAETAAAAAARGTTAIKGSE